MSDPQQQLAVEQGSENERPDYARDLADRFRALKRSRIRKAPSAPNTRASSLGHPCERFLFYERTQNEQRVLHDEELQAIFDIGNLDESYLLRELEEAGVQIVQRGRDFRDAALELSGHVDARLRAPGWPRSLVTEIKSLNPHTWEQVETLADLREHEAAWMRRYYPQLQAYLFLSSEDLGLFALLNKSTGWPRFIEVPLDYEFAEGLLRKAERVRDAVHKGEEPARITGLAASESCPRCAFRHVCCPDTAFGPGVQFFDSLEAEQLIRRRMELASAASEFERVDKALKQILPAQPGELIVGDYAVQAKQQSRKESVMKASSFIVRKYVVIPKGEAH